MNHRSCIIVFVLLFLFHANVIFADEIVREYDRDCNITGHIVTDDDGNKIYYNNSWDRIGHSINRGDTDINYDKDYGRAGKIVWSGGKGSVFDESGNRIGYRKKVNGKTIIYNENWQRKGYER